jgi:DNA primase
VSVQEAVRALANQYLKKIRTSGNDNIIAICPFHQKMDGSDEKHPSFSMSLTKGVYHCFACDTSGTLYTFLHDLGMPRIVIQRTYGSLIDELRKSTPSKRFNALRPDVFVEQPLDESILGFFDYCPTQMVDEQDFPEELLRKMDVGFDPLHGRITFPLRDVKGALLGISGRDVMGSNGPRFKVYTLEYEAFGLPKMMEPRKGIILWNSDRVFQSVYFSRNATVVVVEGFKACLRVIQAGVQNTVALLGKSISEQQKWILETMGATVYLMMDNDVAGQAGLLKVTSQLASGLTVRIVEYPAAQPSDLHVDQVQEALATARNYYEWAMDKENKHNGIR